MFHDMSKEQTQGDEDHQMNSNWPMVIMLHFWDSGISRLGSRVSRLGGGVSWLGGGISWLSGG